jgi:ubiquinone/menaquinone biosynthesis C-methylase UbiE
MTEQRERPTTPDDVYNEFYFLEAMDGAEEFALSGGQKITRRLDYALQIADIQPNQRILDLGCGRGEITFQCAHKHAHAHGLDYSAAAINIANSLKMQARSLGLQMDLERARSDHLPFANGSFDIVFMLDIVEHLYPEELSRTLYEAQRILRTGGQLIIHTMPNADYYNWGYPIYRMLMGWIGRRLPNEPRARWYRGETHVNIQNPRQLKKAVRQSGFFPVDVWLKPQTGTKLCRFVTNLPPWRWILINDILCKARKP